MRNPEDSMGFEVGVELLNSTTRTNYEHICKTMIKKLNLQDEDVLTFYYMVKGRPKVTYGEVTILEEYRILSRELKINKDKNTNISDTKKKKIEKKFYARLEEFLFSSHLLHMLEKCERKNKDETFWNEDLSDDKNNRLLVLFSADGAEH